MTTSSISITRDVAGGQVTVTAVFDSANEALDALGRVLREVTDDIEAYEIEQTFGPAEEPDGEPEGGAEWRIS